MLGIICPSAFEFKALDRKKLASLGAAFVVSGMGKVRAATACAELQMKHRDLKSILLIGFAGGLTADLSTGDVIEPSVFVEQDYNAEPFEKFPNILRQSPRPLLAESRPAVMLTQDRFLKDNPYKGSALEKKFKTLACDMESYAVAYYCRKRRLRCAVVKIISDQADGTADHDFLKACRELSPKLNEVVLAASRFLGDP